MLFHIRFVYKGGEGEITEKKSRFIATVVPVHTGRRYGHTMKKKLKVFSLKKIRDSRR